MPYNTSNLQQIRNTQYSFQLELKYNPEVDMLSSIFSSLGKEIFHLNTDHCIYSGLDNACKVITADLKDYST